MKNYFLYRIGALSGGTHFVGSYSTKDAAFEAGNKLVDDHIFCGFEVH